MIGRKEGNQTQSGLPSKNRNLYLGQLQQLGLNSQSSKFCRMPPHLMSNRAFSNPTFILFARLCGASKFKLNCNDISRWLSAKRKWWSKVTPQHTRSYQYWRNKTHPLVPRYCINKHCNLPLQLKGKLFFFCILLLCRQAQSFRMCLLLWSAVPLCIVPPIPEPYSTTSHCTCTIQVVHARARL